MSEHIQGPKLDCTNIFLQGLYGRRFDSLNEDELGRLHESYLGKDFSGTVFGCKVEGCTSTFLMVLRNGELHPGSMIFNMEGDSSPCLYESKDQAT